MNNKGQVLVLFVLLLPVLLISLLIGIEITNLNTAKTKTQNTIKEIITYNLKNYNENTNQAITTLIEENITDISSKSVFISEDEIRINIIQNKKIFGKNIEIKYSYKGIKQDENIIVSEG